MKKFEEKFDYSNYEWHTSAVSLSRQSVMPQTSNLCPWTL